MSGDALRPHGCQLGYVCPALVAGTFDLAHVTVFRGEVKAEDFPRAYASHAALQQRHPEGTVVFVVAESDVPIPAPEVRTAAMESGKPYESGIACTAVVLFGEGFWRSAARSALTAMLLLTRQPYPIRLFGDVESAVHWSARQVGERHLDAAGLRLAVEYLRNA